MHATDADTDTYARADADTDTGDVLQRDIIWPHEMANDNARHISNYINVYLKNYTSDLRETETEKEREEPSMTSGKYTKVSRYMCICISQCVCVCQALPCK